MKKRYLILAAVLAAGCALGATGCKNNAKNLAVLSSNWYSGIGYKGFQPTICKENFDAERPNVGKEIITYKVTHEALAKDYQNKYYSVSYGEGGTYTTEFYADTFSADSFDYPEEYKAAYAEAGKITAYCYKTVLDVPTITYTLKATKNKEEQTETFNGDNIVTESWFLSVEDYLRPLYSKQSVKSVSPNMLQPNSLTDGKAFKKYDRVYESFYSYDGGSVKTVATDNLAEGEKTTENEVSLGKVKNSLFDLNSMDILARAQNLSARKRTFASDKPLRSQERHGRKLQFCRLYGGDIQRRRPRQTA